ncbi:hypothetical protein D030_3802, partial [Vibrio parahaemolyticus AQ3810]|jgi:hypothetical protein
MPVG